MVRFARIKGVHTKSSFNKVPEDASTWEELKAAPADASETEPENTNYVNAIGSLSKKVEGTWSEFEPEREVRKKKRNATQPESEHPKKKKSKNTDDQSWSEFEPENIVTKKKKKKRSESEPESEQPKNDKSNNRSGESWSEFEPDYEVAEKDKIPKISEEDGSMFARTTDRSAHNGNIVKKSENKSIIPPAKKTRKEKELEGLEFRRKKPANEELLFCIDGKEIKLEKFDGYTVAEERAKKLHALRQQLREEGKDEKDIFGLIKSERRKAEKELKAMKKKLCFHCRKGGHNLSDCPELGNKSDQGSGICFKCGSTEHKLSQCRSKSNTLEYATCFICNEKGHLSRNCTNNPRGLYPDGGGCKTCGDVTHYERDCPKKRKHREVISAKRIDSNDVEALDYDDEAAFRKKPLKIDVGKRPNKIIKF